MIVTVTARFTSASCGRAQRNATAGIGLNLGLDGACFLGDETGSNAMSQDAQHYHVFETAMGFCAIAWSDAGVARFQLPTKTAEAAERLMRRRAFGPEPGMPPEDIAAVVEAAKRYFAGEETDFSQVQLDLAGQDAFFAQIYDSLRRIDWGRTTTYGALAKEVGAGREAARDVGEAMAQKSRAVDHSLSPGAGRRRQNRRFLRAWRLENEGPHARTGGRSPWAARSGTAGFQFLSGQPRRCIDIADQSPGFS
jgi:methylated-DNA-[protein]-cysteine S-methyltransferase